METLNETAYICEGKYVTLCARKVNERDTEDGKDIFYHYLSEVYLEFPDGSKVQLLDHLNISQYNSILDEIM